MIYKNAHKSAKRKRGLTAYRRFFSVPHVVSNLGWTGKSWRLGTWHVALRGLDSCFCHDEYCYRRRRQRRWRIALSEMGEPMLRVGVRALIRVAGFDVFEIEIVHASLCARW